MIEVGGTIYEQENFVWQDLLNLLFSFVNSEEDLKVDAALQVFNGLFSYLMDHLVKFKGDLMQIFAKTLQHASLDINLAALQAVSNFLQIAEGKDAREFVTLLPHMAKVCMKAVEQDDETVLEDALVEFNELAEIEPKFFRKNFKELFVAFQGAVACDAVAFEVGQQSQNGARALLGLLQLSDVLNHGVLVFTEKLVDE